MGHPSYIHLGFFDARPMVPDADIRALQVAQGPDTERFIELVHRLLGDLPAFIDGTGGVHWNNEGILTVALWHIDGQTELADAVLKLQHLSDCQIFREMSMDMRGCTREELARELYRYTHDNGMLRRTPGSSPERPKTRKGQRSPGEEDEDDGWT